MAETTPERAGESGKAGVLAESLRKALVTGLSAVFMTEEGIRSALAEMRLPKEAIGFLVQQTSNTRRELSRLVAEELKGFLRNADFSATVRKALAGMKLEVRAEIRFVEDGARLESLTTESTASTPSGRPPRRRRG